MAPLSACLHAVNGIRVLNAQFLDLLQHFDCIFHGVERHAILLKCRCAEISHHDRDIVCIANPAGRMKNPPAVAIGRKDGTKETDSGVTAGVEDQIPRIRADRQEHSHDRLKLRWQGRKIRVRMELTNVRSNFVSEASALVEELRLLRS